jgi:hypothetical protein
MAHSEEYEDSDIAKELGKLKWDDEIPDSLLKEIVFDMGIIEDE